MRERHSCLIRMRQIRSDKAEAGSEITIDDDRHSLQCTPPRSRDLSGDGPRCSVMMSRFGWYQFCPLYSKPKAGGFLMNI